jgi:catechol 2,3-dioxygenase-like lactoylglutathione lyase family enzyme
MNILHAGFVLAVPNADTTARWWTDVMGFARVLEPEGWVFVQRDGCLIRLGSCPDAIPPRDLGDHQYFGYIEVDAVDRLYEEIGSRGADILFAPTTQPWDMREMGVRTPDGHRVMFAQNVSRPN